MNSVIAAILNSVWQAVAIAACTWAILKFAPRMNAATRHAVWWAVLAAVVALPLAPTLMETSRPRVHTTVAYSAATEGRVSTAPANPSRVYPAVAPPSRAIEVRPGAWRTILPAIWLAILLIQLARILWSYRYVRRLKRRAVPAASALQQRFEGWLTSCDVHRPARLLISSDISSPMAAGFRHPAVLLPDAMFEQFREQELDHVLLHEIAHLARRDDWTNLAAGLATSVVALHPVALWILRRIERERELACDEWVVSMTGEPRPYAQSLTRVFELCWRRKRVLLASGMADRGSHLGSRVEELLRRREFARNAALTKVAASIIALMGFVLAAGGMRPWIVSAQAESQTMPKRARPAPANVAQQPARAPQGGFLAALVAAGYGDLSVEEIIDLKNNGVTAEFINGIRQSGWGKLSARELISLRSHGVPAAYAAEMRDAGLKDIAVDRVVELRNRGVRPEFVSEIHALGFGPYDTRAIIDLHSHGVRIELFRALKDAGFLHPSTAEAIDAQSAGLRDSHFREAKQFGSTLTLPQIIRLRRAGVLQ